jgi:hypothetical protein
VLADLPPSLTRLALAGALLAPLTVTLAAAPDVFVTGRASCSSPSAAASSASTTPGNEPGELDTQTNSGEIGNMCFGDRVMDSIKAEALAAAGWSVVVAPGSEPSAEASVDIAAGAPHPDAADAAADPPPNEAPVEGAPTSSEQEERQWRACSSSLLLARAPGSTVPTLSESAGSFQRELQVSPLRPPRRASVVL